MSGGPEFKSRLQEFNFFILGLFLFSYYSKIVSIFSIIITTMKSMSAFYVYKICDPVDWLRKPLFYFKRPVF